MGWQGGAGVGTAALSAPRLGPVDLVGDDVPTLRTGRPRDNSPFGDEFEDWSDGRPSELSPLAAPINS